MRSTTSFTPIRTIFVLLGLALVAAACGSDDDVAFDGVPLGSITIVSGSDVEFAEISPFAQFGSVQGEFGTGEHGTFGIFGAGAASPPHTHSGTYYAVVLDGEMNNPFGTEAAPATLPAGSFWAVPADDQHVTACLSPNQECSFFFHSAGAFDFFPIDELTEERSAESQSVPLDQIDFESLDPFDGVATMWGDRDSGPHGTIVRLSAGEDTGDTAHREGFSLVPATGSLSVDAGEGSTALAVGSLLEAQANAAHSLSCGDGADCVFYLFADAPLEIKQG